MRIIKINMAELQFPIWSLSPALILVTSTFFLAEHLNYSFIDWILGNGIVALGIGIFYLGDWVHGNKTSN